jgi:hypothetical protein
VLAWLLGRVVDEGFVVERLKRALLLVVVVCSVLIINPDGLRGALYPLTVLDQYGYTIVENKSPAFLKDFGYPQTTVRALYVGILLALGDELLDVGSDLLSLGDSGHDRTVQHQSTCERSHQPGADFLNSAE